MTDSEFESRCFIDSNIWLYAAKNSQDETPDPGQPRRVAIDAVETPLVGVAMLFGYELTVQAVVGGRVSIKPIP